MGRTSSLRDSTWRLPSGPRAMASSQAVPRTSRIGVTSLRGPSNSGCNPLPVHPRGITRLPVTLLLAFGLTLIAATLLSARAERSVLSMAVLFAAAGFLLGPGVAGIIGQHRDDNLTFRLTQAALFAVLFTDGMQAHVPHHRSAVLLPARALLIGLPLTVALNALVCRYVAGLAWAPAWLVAICLGPTDPVLASAIVGRRTVPRRLRSLLNVESGFNDGLAFPALAALLAIQRGGTSGLGKLGLELVGGLGIGIAIALSVVLLCRVRFLEATEAYRPLLGFGAGVCVFATAVKTGGNEYLAAFAAGLTLAFTAGPLRKSFDRFNRSLAELLKLAALLMFGLLITPGLFVRTSLGGYAAAVLMLVAVRPLALGVALARAGLDRREWITAAWFGPKGFASVVYGLLVLHSGVAGARPAASLIGVVVTMSIVAHSSTDVLIARWFEQKEGPKADRPHPAAGEQADDPDDSAAHA